MGDTVNKNYVYSNVNDALPGLMRELTVYGEEFGSRAGKTLELTFVGITLEKPWQREITAPDRKANVAAQIVETMWVLSGRNDVAGLAHYLPRAADFSDDGATWRAGYGPRLRDYHGVDQLDYIVETLADNPSSRQAVCTIWDPTVDSTPGKDIACNNWLTFSSRNGVLDLMVGIRSNDAMWGWSGINAFEWSVLLEVVAGLTGLTMGQLHFAVTSFHLYEQHWEKAERLSKADPYSYDAFTDSPRFAWDLTSLGQFDDLAYQWFGLEEKIRTGYRVDVEAFPEPMLRSWLRVLQWYWSGDETFLATMNGNRLEQACLVGMKPAGKPQDPEEHFEQTDLLKPDMLEHINKLHAEKHAAYGGDSWKKRGEAGILANIARKADRLGTGLETRDEAQRDTAQDLLVSLAKYRCWLEGGTGDPDEVAELLSLLTASESAPSFENDLDALFNMAGRGGERDQKIAVVDRMLEQAYTLSLSLW
jgi:thymidylate synthase